MTCAKTNFPEALLTDDLSQATEWRNDNKVTGTVVVIAFGEEERLGSFHRFTEIRDRDLYQEICRLAEATVCPNKVQTDWWSVLSKAEVIRQVSVFRLASITLAPKKLIRTRRASEGSASRPLAGAGSYVQGCELSCRGNTICSFYRSQGIYRTHRATVYTILAYCPPGSSLNTHHPRSSCETSIYSGN